MIPGGGRIESGRAVGDPHGGFRDAGRLAIVRNVGYPKPDRSHFRSMDIWQTGRPRHDLATGWMGRYLDRSPAGDDALVDAAAQKNLELVNRIANRDLIRPRVIEFYERLQNRTR